jgi:uncharacterized Fe-S cluster protein YjdI
MSAWWAGYDGWKLMSDRDDYVDPRDPDYSREGIFIYHNCWKCDSGSRPCVRGNPRQCEFPHARND